MWVTSRVVGTIAAIERNLLVDGLVLRYSTATNVDALPAGFLIVWDMTFTRILRAPTDVAGAMSQSIARQLREPIGLYQTVCRSKR